MVLCRVMEGEGVTKKCRFIIEIFFPLERISSEDQVKKKKKKNKNKKNKKGAVGELNQVNFNARNQNL